VGLLFIAIVGALALTVEPRPDMTAEDGGSAPSLPGGLPVIAIIGALAPVITPPAFITTEDGAALSVLATGWRRSTKLCSSEAVFASEI